MEIEPCSPYSASHAGPVSFRLSELSAPRPLVPLESPGAAIEVVAVAAITVVVWTIMLARSPRLRATLYSFPVPITIAIVSGPASEPGGQFLGVVLLVVFMYLVAVLDPVVGRVMAVVGGLVGYVAMAAAIHRWVEVPAGTAFGASAVVLGLHQVLVRARPRDVHEVASQAKPGLLEFGVVPVSTSLTWALGSVLGPFVVTFPYSGVPTALAIRNGRLAFALSFGRRAWLLLGFLGLFHLAREYMSTASALGIAWLVFLAVTAWMSRGDLREILSLRRLTESSCSGRACLEDTHDPLNVRIAGIDPVFRDVAGRGHDGAPRDSAIPDDHV